MSSPRGQTLADLRTRFDGLSRRLAQAGDVLVAGRRDLIARAADRLAALQPESPPETPENPDEFAGCAIYAICATSVTDAVASRTFERCRRALQVGGTARSGFRHAAKAEAIDRIWRERERLFRDYAQAADKLAFIGGLPGIGTVTKHRLARRLGLIGIEGSGPARLHGGHAPRVGRAREVARLGRARG
ncbi:hypothetical protein [Salinarimonas soli]|uniref:Uncharacterized protein n=1 Tax=Salinarimonas soli TaxID=1638099 RepID=A0A5B2VH26_9HYPH|nr:hypothetical protein [Salinarimonas soli]KAA2237639.1 hypothetical protein F0L46_08135 [Salinarimonas soli]